ncbi:hypothetical protein [Bacillus fungorum]|uniref:hypothetical protein n=1 Tax=Bacillus fungorum TaxID=2039284 RepID=UPI003F559BEF
MAKKKKGFHINKDSLTKIISDYCQIIKIEIKNPSNAQTRYTLKKDDISFEIDVYFRTDKTITVTALNGTGGQFSQELYGIIRDSDGYQNAGSGNFSTELAYESFQSLSNFLKELPGVTQTMAEDKGVNGLITKYSTDFGDSVTLTYYQSTGKMFYQGRLMKLYVIIKEFLVPLTKQAFKTNMNFISSQTTHDSLVDSHINNNLPKGYQYLDPIMANFIKDSFTLAVANTKLNDYAAWVMPTIRVLEHRIKQICLDNGYFIDDEKGFKYFTIGTQTEWLFCRNAGNTVVNNNISTTLGTDTCDILVRCYEYLKTNRHEMFHTTQIAAGTKLVPTSEEALSIIQGACKLIEESLIYKLSSTTV